MENLDSLDYRIVGSMIHIKFLRAEGQDDDCVLSPIFVAYENSFIGAVNRLMGYHNECVSANDEGKTNVYSGVGSERGEWLDRTLLPWRMFPNRFLLEPEKRLLEGIVSMHNQVCATSKKILASEKS